jgi:hypothetical protein
MTRLAAVTGEVANWQEARAVLRLMLTSTATTPRTDRQPPLVFGGCLLPRPGCGFSWVAWDCAASQTEHRGTRKSVKFSHLRLDDGS